MATRLPPLRAVLYRSRAPLAVMVSCAAHLVGLAAVDQAEGMAASPRGVGRFVVMEQAEPAATDPPQPLPAEESPTVERALRNAAAPRPAAPEPLAAHQPDQTAVAAVEPLDLTGVTLAGDSGSSWSSVVGNGRSMMGPLGPVRRRPTPPARASKAKGNGRKGGQRPRRPADVKLADLSDRPVPANLDSRLRLNYPKQARDEQISGVAVVRARIGPAGRVGRVQVMSESYGGFGAACSATVQGSMWSVPRDRKGRAVATWIRYTCRFAIER
jgi:TonB family protein